MARKEKATFAAGCFWGIEHNFRQMPGVIDTRVGYAGGDFDTPTYDDVCSGRTGHAEAVEILYDPDRISYQDLLEAFWRMHDPTQLNRQGVDVGSQYRSAIYTHTEDQERLARQSRENLDKSGHYSSPVVTEIEPAPRFWQAEAYHQRYFEKQG